jgi:NADPH:quinone reductase-like Zn-dependent oxidoreductase
VLIPSTGGVALFGLQIAKAHGAKVIVVGNAAKRAQVQALGADHFIDKQQEDFVEAVLELTGNQGVQHVLEVVGGAHLGKSVQVTAVGGHICQIGALDGFELSTPAMPLMLKDLTIHGIGTGHRRALERFTRAIDQTGLKPVIGARYPLGDLPTALDQLDRGAFGKIVLDVAR